MAHEIIWMRILIDTLGFSTLLKKIVSCVLNDSMSYYLVFDNYELILIVTVHHLLENYK